MITCNGRFVSHSRAGKLRQFRFGIIRLKTIIEPEPTGLAPVSQHPPLGVRGPIRLVTFDVIESRSIGLAKAVSFIKLGAVIVLRRNRPRGVHVVQERKYLRFGAVIWSSWYRWLSAYTGVRDSRSYYVTIKELNGMGNTHSKRRVAGNVAPGSIKAGYSPRVPAGGRGQTIRVV